MNTALLRSRAWVAASLIGLAATPLSATVLRVEAPQTRSAGVLSVTDAAVRRLGKNVASLTALERRRRTMVGPFSLPSTVIVTRNGRYTPPPAGSRGGPDIVLNFATTGARAFPTDYANFLSDVYTRVKPRLDAVFGSPGLGGNVTVSNFDADIGARDAVAGGYFVVDGTTGTQEIRFPVYADTVGYKLETAAVNFVHCLLLAYIGDKTLPTDGWQEGLVRAATMQVCRTPGALPTTLDTAVVEGVLQATYDVTATYDTNNQRALSGPTFIAPNLRDVDLPAGGSTGGLYLLRYQMAGTAMQKVLVQYPLFAQEFLARFYPVRATVRDLDGLAQQSLNALSGAPGTQVEGRSFSDWRIRQRILDGQMTIGTKLMVDAFPISSGLGGNDFGVFGIQAQYFRTDPNGNETLLRGTAYPIFWSPDFTRFFGSAQDDRINISNGYGSVAPNFPGTAFNGEPYRVTVDVPVSDQLARVYLPAGAVATAAQTTPRNAYGVITGLAPGATSSVRITWGAESQTVTCFNGAFGALLATTFEAAVPNVLVEVLETTTSGTRVALTRRVNKGPGALGLTLHIDGDRTLSLPSGLTGGIQMMGYIGDPFRGSLRDVLPSSVLASRWDATTSRYVFLPNFNPDQGQGFFVRAGTGSSVTYDGLLPTRTTLTTAGKPGWNMIVNPLDESVLVDNLQSIVATGFPRVWTEAATANQVGLDVFGFIPGVNDPVTGIPETGTLQPISTLAPGQAAFVKVIASEGSTIAFVPGLNRSRDAGRRPALDVRVTATVGGRSAWARVGFAAGATRGLDPGLDSDLPPGQGGLQVSGGGGRRLVADFRGLGRVETFPLKLENVRAGDRVKLDVATVAGRPGLVVLDVPGLKRTVALGKGTLEFVARSASPTVTVVLPRRTS